MIAELFSNVLAGDSYTLKPIYHHVPLSKQSRLLDCSDNSPTFIYRLCNNIYFIKHFLGIRIERMKDLLKWIAIIFVGLIIIGIIFGDDSPQTVAADDGINESPSEQTFPAAPEQIETTTVNVVQEEAEPEGLSRPQKNAVRSAEQYISMTGFSREGLIGQLSSDGGEGYDVTDATIAIDSLSIDWNEQAVRSAEQYLDMMGFSCNGLIDQLSSDGGEGYTVAQATYGAQQAGACS